MPRGIAQPLRLDVLTGMTIASFRSPHLRDLWFRVVVSYAAFYPLAHQLWSSFMPSGHQVLFYSISPRSKCSLGKLPFSHFMN